MKASNLRIDFNQLAKPANLQNSAVLKMLEEEETRRRNGGQPDLIENKISSLTTMEVREIIRPKNRCREYWPPLCPQDGRRCRLLFCPSSGLKRVAWPPPQDYDEVDYIEQSPVQAKTRGLGDYVSYQSSPVSGPSPQPVSPGGTLKQPSHFQQQPNIKNWAPVTPPTTSPIPPSWSQHSNQSPSHYQSSQHHQSSANFEPPPTTITLRPKAPFSQDPSPVYQAQPAATMAPMSGVMRGDLKWPPESVKYQTEMENQARMALAKGPAFRPRRPNKDYSQFFAQHALNSTYPGYRAPPGTQYFTPSYQH
ncbi:DNA-directed RNA polymerase II subunit RPB1-like isoform X2 [Microplitis mediator]|uniref:DNA-directed RNA polymerase II subunit RPB1-like isoform X2 n=1 Tax=Microplitis mediator TaxID=375433 RepID=UPI002553A325|nr:DNA-directed RNA polymerase II subunit RPB1-like isoform X2 [Microplitis mediator]